MCGSASWTHTMASDATLYVVQGRRVGKSPMQQTVDEIWWTALSYENAENAERTEAFTRDLLQGKVFKGLALC